LEEIKFNSKEFTFPLVVKPTDSSGSKGVTKLDDWSGLEKAVKWADSYSRNKTLLIEEYIQRGYPSVIGGDIFVWDGKIVLYGEMECLRDLVISPLVPIGEIKPANITISQIRVIHSELQRIVTALDIRYGELNIEIILDKEDKVHFLELGPRAGGNMIPIQLSDAFGVDLVKANVQAAMGVKPDFVDKSIKEHSVCYMHYVLHSYQNGFYRGIEFDAEIEDYIYRKCIYKHIGDTVEAFDGAGKALGIIFLKFPDVETMNRYAEKMENYITYLIS
jgi:biotin carboxylase